MPPFSVAGLAAPGRQQQPAVPVTSAAERAYDSLCYDFPVPLFPCFCSFLFEQILLSKLRVPHSYLKLC